MRKISKVRFEALSYARMPLVKIMSDEIEWYANENNAILGTILHDYTDDDYVVVVLGRDEAGVFRWIDGLAGIESIDEARATLSAKITEQSREGAEEFPQGVITRDKNLIFSPLVSEARMPEDYKTLVNSEFFSPAKELIQEIAYSFEDPDGNYIEQFQSTGFNARLWELYLYALFHEMDFTINREFNAPDYVVDKAGLRVCIEAVTVNPSQHLVDEPEPTSTEEMERLLSDYMPIKYGSPLYSKLKKKYWEKAHVAQNPLVIAIHDFHQKDSMMWSRKSLEAYLYGARRTYSYSPEDGLVQSVELITEHRWNNKVIPSNFFSQPDGENISAVIHSNQATIGKFLRMGYLAEFGRQDLDIKFVGQAIYDNNQAYIDFDMNVIPEEYKEYWRDSITIYHNPNALRPLDHRLFPDVAHVFFLDGKFSSIKPQYYPVHGRTFYRVKET
ncbi:hypothetical protein PO25_17555 [Vibrio anguillarum]|uniref:hypothetical protein n=1 Tax=Vibrio anguillarum TaxID=55601 RepID=UPI00097E2261|nr:hypothetical protein [Vibrio anguillarum]MBT2949677.1 hypothetical protein [Vibrio anguillarum]